MSKLTRVKLSNFTAFAEFEHTFSPGVTVMIGGNGTGKTHLLKVLYAACAITVGESKDLSFVQKLVRVFNPFEARIGRLARRSPGTVKSRVTVEREGGLKVTTSFSSRKDKATGLIARNNFLLQWKDAPLQSAYIPVKEMLAHAPGFIATTAKRELAFEDVYSDILKLAYLPPLRGPVDHQRRVLLTSLQKVISGKVQIDGEYFFLKNSQGKLEFSLLAEGLRKLALVSILINNGTLGNGSVLFWDEPEANLNPSLMGQIAEILLELQRRGVQIIVSTHNQILLREFDLRKKKTDAVEYLSLFLSEKNGGVNCVSGSDLEQLQPNLMSETSDSIYDREIARSLNLDRA